MSTPRGTEQPSPVLSGLCLANRPLASFRERAPPSPEVTARPSAEEGRKRPAAVRGAAPREERSAEQRGAAARPRRPGIKPVSRSSGTASLVSLRGRWVCRDPVGGSSSSSQGGLPGACAAGPGCGKGFPLAPQPRGDSW